MVITRRVDFLSHHLPASMATAEAEAAYTWSPPTYDLSTPPTLKQTFIIEDDEGNHENFPRNARWTPDGSVFMAHCENRTLQLFNAHTNTSLSTPNNPTLTLPQPSPILDFTWFPSASPNDPASYCFLASVRECPVKLLDASDGRDSCARRIRLLIIENDSSLLIA